MKIFENFSLHSCSAFSLHKKATSKNQSQLAACARETQEEHPTNGESRNTSLTRVNEDYITQVFEDVESRVTKNFSQEVSKTESCILAALFNLNDFLWSPQVRTQSGTVPHTSRNTDLGNQEPNEGCSHNDRSPEVGSSVCWSQQSVDSDTEKALYREVWLGFCVICSTDKSRVSGCEGG